MQQEKGPSAVSPKAAVASVALSRVGQGFTCSVENTATIFRTWQKATCFWHKHLQHVVLYYYFHENLRM